jgi:hypothetical protein
MSSMETGSFRWRMARMLSIARLISVFPDG